jgi:Zn-dependent protease
VFNVTPELILAIAIILLVSFPVHEFFHAWTAWKLGDGTAKLFGRLTLNPLAHLDPMGAIILAISAMVGFGIGWAKPTPVNPSNLRGGRSREGWVAAAGPLSNLVLAAIAAVVIRIMVAADLPFNGWVEIVANTLWIFIGINISLFVFNLIPIPPLDGSKVMFSLMNPMTVFRIRPTLEQYGFILLLIVAIVPIGDSTLLGRIVGPLITNVRRILVGF